MKEPIGYTDKNGTDIREGDLVEFWFDADFGVSPVAHDDYTRMVDVVEIIDGKPYFTDKDIEGSAFAWRFAHACSVIGNIHEVPVLT